ncbi:DHA3 family macrolide efflux protein-like MFS transporter [Weissella uvarum]|uniref:MFS transporter n=1 Tax=Weissella uvarum TaxID=1479233 RepID=UPI001960D698|nr:MFS transporter [Weissella uvarum]MBM7617407.1 DHA3 family macrolide efflux protein-like MFS transporter [Weissella uvarum]MCM0595708.1 MFS transporter [Weissella uvarum]
MQNHADSTKPKKVERNVNLLLISQFLTGITSMTVQYAIMWYLTEQTHSATTLSIATLIGMLPMIVLSPFAGTIVDRYNKKVLLIAPDVVAALVAGGLSLYLHQTSAQATYLIFAVLFIRAVAQTFQMPTLQSIIPTITPEDKLTRVNGRFSVIQSVNMILAPALGAFLFGIISIEYLLLLDILGAFFGILILRYVNIPSNQTTGEKQSVKQAFIDMRTGFQLLRSKTGLWITLLIGAVGTLFVMPTATLYPLMTTNFFKLTVADAGIVEVLYSVGMLSGGLIISLFGKWKNRMIPFVLSYVILGATFLLSGLLPANFTGFIWFNILAALSGISVPFFETILNSMIQQSYEAKDLGKVMGATLSVLSLPGPIGLIVIGPLGDSIGLTTVFIIAGIAILLCVPINLAFKSARNYDINLQKSIKNID